MNDDPKRMLDDASVSARLQGALSAGAGELPDAQQLARLADRLGPLLDPGGGGGGDGGGSTDGGGSGDGGGAGASGDGGATGASGGGATGASGGGATGASAGSGTSGLPGAAAGVASGAPTALVKVGVTAAVATAIAALAIGYARRDPDPPADAPAANAQARPHDGVPLNPSGSAADSSASQASAAESAKTAATPAAEPNGGPAGHSGASRSTTGAGSSPAPSAAAARPSASASPKPSEIALLRQAQSALGGSPSRALQVANQHSQLYPNGRLSQEREVIAIQALLKTGQAPAARSRAKRFIVVWPRSSHTPRVRTLVGLPKPNPSGQPNQ